MKLVKYIKMSWLECVYMLYKVKNREYIKDLLIKVVKKEEEKGENMK